MLNVNEALSISLQFPNALSSGSFIKVTILNTILSMTLWNWFKNTFVVRSKVRWKPPHWQIFLTSSMSCSGVTYHSPDSFGQPKCVFRQLKSLKYVWSPNWASNFLKSKFWNLFFIYFHKMVSILVIIIQHEQYFFSFQAHVSAVFPFLSKSCHIMLKSHVSSLS